MKRVPLKMPNRLTRHGLACYKSDAPTPEQIAERESLLNEIQTRMSSALERKISKEDFDKIIKPFEALPIEAIREMADKDNGVVAMLQKQGNEIIELQSRIAQKPEDLSLRAQITKWHDENKDAIKNIRAGKRVELPSLEIRAAASPMTVATVNSGTSPYIPTTFIEPGVNDIPRFQLTFWNYLRKGSTNSAVYGWVNKTNPQGAAAFIGAGVAKPGISFELISDVSNAKKIAVSAKSVTELLDDIAGMESFIRDELRYQLDVEVNNKLMSGVASATVPAGIQSLSLAYNAYTGFDKIKTDNPNYMDCIRAVVGVLRAGKLSGPITGFINPIDAANMDLAKAAGSGVYVIPPFTTADGRTIGGATILEDQNVAIGKLQIGFLDYYRVLIYKPFVVNTGWENDDFTKNMMTWIAEMRLHQIFNQQYTGAFCYDDFATIQGAIANP